MPLPPSTYRILTGNAAAAATASIGTIAAVASRSPTIRRRVAHHPSPPPSVAADDDAVCRADVTIENFAIAAVSPAAPLLCCRWVPTRRRPRLPAAVIAAVARWRATSRGLAAVQVVDDHTSRGARLLGGVKVRALLARVSNACTRALTHHHVL